MKVFKLEWKNIFTNRILLGSLIVLMLVPIMYSGIFLSSAWDPYGRTENLPVAVVNLDQPAKYGGKTLNLGEELVNQLKDNTALDWHFIEKAQAEQGLEDGEYYMVITVPADFSANASTVLDTNPKPMNLTYETNPGRNYFASVVSSQAAASVKNSIATNVTEEYAQALLDQLGTIGDGFSSAASGSRQIQEGIIRVQEGNHKITDGLQKLADSTLTFSEGANQIVVAVNSVQNGANRLYTGAKQLNQGVSAYTAGVSALQSGSRKFTQGADQLASSTPALIAGARKLSEGVEQIAPGLESLNKGTQSALEGSHSLTQGLQGLSTAASQLSDAATGVPSLVNGQSALQSAISKLQTGSSALQEGLGQLNGSLPSEEQMKQLTQGLSDIQKGINGLSQSVSAGSDMSAAVPSVKKSLESAQNAVKALSAQAQTNGQDIIASVTSTSAYQALNTTQQQEMLTALSDELSRQGEQQKSRLESLSASLTDLSGTLNNQVLTAVQGLNTLPSALQKLNGAVNQVNPKASAAISGYSAIASAINDKLLPGSTALNHGLTQAAAGSSQLVSGVQKLNSQMPVLASGTQQLYQGSQSLTQGLTALADGSGRLADASAQFGTGASSFSSGVTKYSEGLQQLNRGAVQIGGGLDQLASKSGDLSRGAESLLQGIGTLSSNLPALANGVQKLSGGAEQIHSGSSSLLDGSQSLGEGIEKLNSGSAELSSKLTDGAAQIQNVNKTEANAGMIANPINLEKNEYSEVPNYGHALAPYVLVLGLFVGAIAFNLVFPLSRPTEVKATGFSWWLSKFSVGALQAAFAALVMNVIMLYGMDLQVDHLGPFVLLSVLASITFMFLVMLLNVAFGNLGRLLSMILLVIQLGASGGMFPMQLSNSFFQSLHSYLPMTYSVEGMREVLSSSMASGQYTQSMMVLSGFMILFNVLLFGAMFGKARKDSSMIETTESNATTM
ncbi:YhgE/Pip domain-containing protein [Paenibacillus apii]|uniref:YhgE/Pip domain-containing protein n=1 Tax=Paenibacillus apii TaxID=1850370 RepID=UPI00143AFE00|nr:YhgE/Pip domain-containing protein [Paenibacillus apii]NJJ38316.1 YhgE/Pip domain-containing protein [Paenibacillus apii]